MHVELGGDVGGDVLVELGGDDSMKHYHPFSVQL